MSARVRCLGVVVGASAWALVGCSGSAADGAGGADGDGGGADATVRNDAGRDDSGGGDARIDVGTDAAGEAASDAATAATCSADGGGGTGCYAIACTASPQTLQANRDRLVADFAKRRCTDGCSLWAALNQGERYVFLMDTAYLAASSSLLYPPASGKTDTALDHAIALYSINGPKAGEGTDGSGRGGIDWNRAYIGFDALATCVMRNFAAANPAQTPSYNEWQKSDDLAGPHAPFTQREMIFWYKALFDLQSNGPQFHHWAKDSDFDPNGLNQRLGVCGVTDRSLTELTVAFDYYHNSDPLGDYAGRGGFGWQIVDQHINIAANWAYMPTGCAVTPPVNTDPYGGGTFAGMGPSLNGSACTSPALGDGGC